MSTDVPRWHQPTVGGIPPLPRRSHTLSALRSLGEQGIEQGIEQGTLFLFGGLGYGLGRVFASAGEHGATVYLNDLHAYNVSSSMWTRIIPQGSPPSPRAGHTATLAPDGRRLVVFGGMDGSGSLSDLHVLDCSLLVWFQLYASGSYPTARHSHAAV